jgi:hypothetical protein
MAHHRTFSADDKMAAASRSHVSAAPETTNITNESFTPESETVSPPTSPRMGFFRQRSKSDAATKKPSPPLEQCAQFPQTAIVRTTSPERPQSLRVSRYGRHGTQWLFGGFSFREALGITVHKD